jgi:hypothetical protein
MNWTSVIDVLFEAGELFSAIGLAYGAWLYMKSPSAGRDDALGPNRPKTLGWRE